MSVRLFENHHPDIAADVFVDPTALVIGDVSIATGSSIWPFATLRGDVHKISIGEHCNIQDHAVLHVSHDSAFSPGGFALSLAAGITVGHRATLHGCTIHSDCLIGMGAIVMDGAIIETHSLIAAGALVPPGKRLAGGQLWAGQPARAIRPLTADELAFIAYSAKHYTQLGARHKQSLEDNSSRLAP